MLKTPTLIAVAALVAAAALVNGAVTQRWSAFVPNPARTEALHGLQVKFEDWSSAPFDTEMPTNERSTATSRRYVSPRTGHAASVTFISGPPGSVSTHTPDVCYPGSGYKTLRAARKDVLELPGGAACEFYVADFVKSKKASEDRARVRWAWTTDGKFVAPDNPRWQFARQLATVPVLYKVYIVTPIPEADGDDRPDDDAVTRAFVRAAWVQYAARFEDDRGTR